MDERPPGVEFHTLTIIGRCPARRKLGPATATRSLAVGARVPHVRVYARVPPLDDWLHQHAKGEIRA